MKPSAPEPLAAVTKPAVSEPLPAVSSSAAAGAGGLSSLSGLPDLLSQAKCVCASVFVLIPCIIVPAPLVAANKAKAEEAFAATRGARQEIAAVSLLSSTPPLRLSLHLSADAHVQTAQVTAKRVDEVDPDELERRRQVRVYPPSLCVCIVSSLTAHTPTAHEGAA